MSRKKCIENIRVGDRIAVGWSDNDGGIVDHTGRINILMWFTVGKIENPYHSADKLKFINATSTGPTWVYASEIRCVEKKKSCDP